jgi:hypothetical protein
LKLTSSHYFRIIGLSSQSLLVALGRLGPGMDLGISLAIDLSCGNRATMSFTSEQQRRRLYSVEGILWREIKGSSHTNELETVDALYICYPRKIRKSKRKLTF